MIPQTMIDEIAQQIENSNVIRTPAHHQADPAKLPGTAPVIRTLQDYVSAAKAAESDPAGLSAKDKGAKLDAGKLRAAMVESQMARALAAVYQVGTDGAAKYSDGGWLWVENGFERYSDAEARHRLKRAMGEAIDKDSKSLHLAHEAWNSLAKLELYLRDQEKIKV